MLNVAWFSLVAPVPGLLAILAPLVAGLIFVESRHRRTERRLRRERERLRRAFWGWE
jgi:hypothetical protein